MQKPTAKNYFSPEMQMAYMGASQFKDFMNCEAAAIAKITGEFQEEESIPLLVGSYVDSFFSGELETFQALHPVLFKKGGKLKAPYLQAEQIIERIQKDEMFMRYLSGDKQTIKTGKIAGVPFKIKIDSYHLGRCLVDLKIVRDFESIWNEAERQKVHWIEAWGYDYQAAIYQAIEGNGLPFYIAAATKEDTPDIALYQIPEDRLAACLGVVQALAPRFERIKQSLEEPRRCGKCDYCKATKKLTRVYFYENP